MARYVDGFVLPVKKKSLAKYKKIAAQAGKAWMKHGALMYLECVEDDLKPNTGGMKIKTFPELAKPKKDEVLLYSFIIYKSRAHRDKVNKKVLSDPGMKDAPECTEENMGFDPKRMTFGGFKSFVHLESN